jgi:hypothetical protein
LHAASNELEEDGDVTEGSLPAEDTGLTKSPNHGEEQKDVTTRKKKAADQLSPGIAAALAKPRGEVYIPVETREPSPLSDDVTRSENKEYMFDPEAFASIVGDHLETKEIRAL